MPIGQDFSIPKTVWKVYGFPIVMSIIAIVPGCNMLYSFHGGPAWFVLPFVFPAVIYRLYSIHRAASQSDRPVVRSFAIRSIGVYFGTSLLFSYLAAYSINHSLGVEVSAMLLWGLFTFPFGLIFSWEVFVGM